MHAITHYLSSRSHQANFWLAHVWLPLAALVLLSLVLLGLHGDLLWADWLFAREGHQWTLKSAYLTETVLHRYGRDASVAALVVVLGGAIGSTFNPRLARWRAPLVFLVVSTLLSALTVAWVKSWSNMDCPWDLVRYGGDRDYIGLFARRPPDMPHGRCFPAGHASAGFAWLALYFFFLATQPRWRWRWLGLGIGLITGTVFGLSQQLRGAHFVSHDVWTAAICWFIALAMYPWFLRTPAARARSAAAGAEPVAITPRSRT